MGDEGMKCRIVPAPHRPENVPRNCWTCSHHEMVNIMTTCPFIDAPLHSKIGMEPCERYDLDAVWLMVDWCFIDTKGAGA